MFSSIEDVIERFAKNNYIASRRIATVIYLASEMRKPILVEGPAGVGKTDLAKVLSASLGFDMIRLQCYEGLDEGKALYEWEYAKQLLYTQILKDKISEVLVGAKGLTEAVDRIAAQDEVFFSERFVLPRPLLKAISSEQPSVLLIDEIDKADAEFEAFLLELLSDFQVTVPELGTLKAKHIPLVVLTSNNAREMSDALKRRCLHLYIDFPDRAQELAIVKLKVPEAAIKLAEEVVTVVQSLRKLDLKKTPGISETLDWVKALTLLNVDSLDQELVTETLDTIVKYEGDVRKAQEKLVEFANLLRENGVRVSLAETLDAFSASEVTGLTERDAFRAALRATMVKRSTELPVFEELFDIYFSGLGEIIKQASQSVQNALSMSDQEFQKFLDEVTEMLKKEGKNLSELAKKLLQNNSGELERKINEAARAVKLSGIERTIEENYFARALARQLGLDKIEAEIKNLREQLEKMDVGSELKAKLEEYLERRLKALDDIIRRFVRMEREKRDIKQKEDQKLNQIGEKSFYYLSEDELKKKNEAVTRLAQRLKNVITVRRKRAKKGRFDIKRTLRQNLEYGGVPFKLRFEKRKREKPQVVILCDVSDSVRNASRFMLQFVY